MAKGDGSLDLATISPCLGLLRMVTDLDFDFLSSLIDKPRTSERKT